MGLVLDVFLLNLDKLIDDPDLVLTESFMMSMFSKFLNEFPPMKAYWDLIFKRNEVKVICRHTGAIMLRLVEVRDEAFTPTNRTNKRVSTRVITLGYTAFVAIRADMMDVKKQLIIICLALDCTVHGKAALIASSVKRGGWKQLMIIQRVCKGGNPRDSKVWQNWSSQCCCSK